MRALLLGVLIVCAMSSLTSLTLINGNLRITNSL